MKLRIFVLMIANLVAFAGLLYMFDIFGVVNYYSLMRDRISPVIPSFVSSGTERIEDMYLLEKDDMAKMRLSFDQRQRDLDTLSEELNVKSSNISSVEQELQQERDNIALAWQTLEEVEKEKSNYDLILTDMASKWGSMPPASTVAIITEHSNNNEQQLIIDVLNKMDVIAAETGASSITSFLISQLDPVIAASIFERYEKRAGDISNLLEG